jgi:hypothetical protein
MSAPSGRALAAALVATLPPAQDGLFNPWARECPDDASLNTPAARLARLGEHLAIDAALIVCGEAGGHLGMRSSGLAFTSERLLMQGAVPRVSQALGRLSLRPRPLTEPSATLVWRALYLHGLAERTITWNALPLHPHQPGRAFSNRTPTDAELALGSPAIELLRAAQPGARWVAVGRKAEQQLACVGIEAIAVRHPANGGAREFAAGMARVATTVAR